MSQLPVPKAVIRIKEETEEYFQQFARRIRGVYTQSYTPEGLPTLPSPFFHPKRCFKTIKEAYKERTYRRHCTLTALDQMVKYRVMNGPELNCVLFGIPFLIDFNVDYGLRNARKKPKPIDHRRFSDQAIYFPMQFKPTAKSSAGLQDANSSTSEESSGSGSSTSSSSSARLEHIRSLQQRGPYAHFALRVYLACVNNGINPDFAHRWAGGELTEGDLSEHLSEEELPKFIEFFEDNFGFDTSDTDVSDTDSDVSDTDPDVSDSEASGAESDPEE
jgi:hypothetical protein